MEFFTIQLDKIRLNNSIFYYTTRQFLLLNVKNLEPKAGNLASGRFMSFDAYILGVFVQICIKIGEADGNARSNPNT